MFRTDFVRMKKYTFGQNAEEDIVSYEESDEIHIAWTRIRDEHLPDSNSF